MISRTLLIFTLMLLLAGIVHGTQVTASWNDPAGSSLSTHYPPANRAANMEFRVAAASAAQQTTPAQPEVTGQGTERSRLEAEAAALRKEEAELRQKAAGLTAEADEQLRLAKKQHYKERYQRRAGLNYREAGVLIKQAEELAGKAEALERRAAELK